jgi:hypothetical protein
MKFTDSSGRQFTNYQPNCQMYNNLQNQYLPNSNQDDFRIFLQQNTDKLLQDFSESNYSEFNSDSGKNCPVCKTSLNWKPTGN